MNEVDPLDYLEVNFNIKEKYAVLPGIARLSRSELERVPHLRLIMKNAVLHHLAKVRQRTRTNPLSDILMQALQIKQQ